MLTGGRFFPQGCYPIVSNHSWSESNSSLLLQKPRSLHIYYIFIYYILYVIFYIFIYSLYIFIYIVILFYLIYSESGTQGTWIHTKLSLASKSHTVVPK